MDVFALRDQLVKDYRHYAESFLTIKDERIREHVERELDEGLLWPDPPLQLNPAFEPGGYIDELVQEGLLHAECARIFRVGQGAPGRQRWGAAAAAPPPGGGDPRGARGQELRPDDRHRLGQEPRLHRPDRRPRPPRRVRATGGSRRSSSTR